ncbi:hypothetical protein Aperf_G00000001553 [Anoplocephala perfoliata]
MYDRAERKLILTDKEDFGPNLGPANYYVKCEYTHCESGGHVPFGSSSQRNTIFDIEEDCPLSPAVYYPELPRKHIKGCASVRNREVRFSDTKSIAPGPGAYEIKSRWPTVGDDTRVLSIPLLLSMCNLKKSIRRAYRTFPSITAALDAHGYEMDACGQLEPRKAENSSCRERMHPAEAKMCEKYRGCKWSSRTERRNLHSPPNNFPGPGTYSNTINDEWVRIVLQGLKRDCINSRHVLKIPRAMEKFILDSTREDIPPPGSYFVEGDQLPQLNSRRPPFASSKMRFKVFDKNTPPPGSYNIKGDKFNSICALKNRKQIPFSSTGVRIADTNLTDYPGPSSYKLPSLAELVTRRIQRRKLGKLAPFDSTCSRITMVPDRIKSITSMNYLPNSVSIKCSDPEIVSSFKKPLAIRRIPKQEQIPPPNAYNVTMAYNAMKGSKSFRISRDRKDKEAFLCSSERFTCFDPIKAAFCANPGPGAYCIKRDPQLKPGSIKRTEERFSKVTDHLPGPADYKSANPLHPTSHGADLSENLSPNIFVMLMLQCRDVCYDMAVRGAKEGETESVP